MVLDEACQREKKETQFGGFVVLVVQWYLDGICNSSLSNPDSNPTWIMESPWPCGLPLPSSSVCHLFKTISPCLPPCRLTHTLSLDIPPLRTGQWCLSSRLFPAYSHSHGSAFFCQHLPRSLVCERFSILHSFFYHGRHHDATAIV